MSQQSRFEEISRKRSLRNTVFIIAGIILLVVSFFFYGPSMLINLSLLAGIFNKDNDTGISTDLSYIAPPVLDPIRDATNSAQIAVTGSALPGQEIRLYVNGRYVDSVRLKDKRIFVFKDVVLEPGDNDLKVKAVVEDEESNYSQNLRIVYKDKAPNLELNSPQDGQSISSGDSQVRVEGETDPSARVTINGYWGIVESDGSFSYLLHLQKGDNIIKVEARDDAGNKSEKEIKVKLE